MKQRLIGIIAFLALFFPIWAFALPDSGEATQKPIMVDMILTRSHVQPGQALSGVVGIRTNVPGAVTFDLTLPDGLILESIESLGGNTCTTSGQTVTCSAANAQNGNPQQLTAQLTVDSSVAAGMDLTAIATGTISGTTVVAQDTAFVIGVPATATPSLQPTAAATAQPTAAATAQPTAAATAQPTAAATAQPTAGSLPVVPTDAAGPGDTESTELPVIPEATPVITPSTAPAPDLFDATLTDRFENNYDPFHATLIVPSAVLTGLNFVAPSTVITGDVDYVQWFGKANRCYELETQDLHPDLDTNIEIITAENMVLAGNDDGRATTPASSLQWCPLGDGPVFARIAQNINVPLPDPRGKTYALALRISEPAGAPEPTSAPVAAVPAADTSVGKGDAAPVQLPSLPSFSSPAGSGSPVVSVRAPAEVSVPSPASNNPEPLVSITTGNDTTSTTVDCDPLIDEPITVDDTGITAGVETCENQVQIPDVEMPTGTVHVAAERTALYSGPGAQYGRLAILPADTNLQMTGRYRNGWVAVRMTSIPLIGWVFAAHLQVDSWDSGIAEPTPAALPSNPDVTQPTTPTLSPTPITVGNGGTLIPLQIQLQPSQQINLVVQVCNAGKDASARCLTGDGIAQAPIHITSLTGDPIAKGMTDGSGRWIIQLSRNAGRVIVDAPLLGINAEIDLRTSQGSQLMVPLIAQRSDIPPTFR